MVTLHVGLGTFKPITADLLKDHAMHSEKFAIGAEAAEALNRAKKESPADCRRGNDGGAGAGELAGGMKHFGKSPARLRFLSIRHMGGSMLGRCSRIFICRGAR